MRLPWQPSQFLYDYPELAFLTWLLYAAMTQRVWLFTLLYPLAILNKEPDVLAIIYLAAFLPRENWKILAVPIASGLAAFVFSHWQVHGNPGGSTEWHLSENLPFLLTPTSYFTFFQPVAPYVFLPRGYNVLILALIIWACFHRWKERPSPLRIALTGLGMLNIALMLLFGQKDEIRDFILIAPLVFAHACWLAADTAEKKMGDDALAMRKSASY